MKYLVKLFVITFFLIASIPAMAEQKIVVLDMKYVLNQSKAGKGAQDFLKKTFEDNQKKFSNMEKSLKKEESDLLAKKNILSKEEFEKKMNALRKKSMDYQTERRSSIDKIASLRSKARKTLLDELKPIIESYINDNDVSLVIDKKNILGGGNNYDVTNVIVEKLNKELPSLNLK